MCGQPICAHVVPEVKEGGFGFGDGTGLEFKNFPNPSQSLGRLEGGLVRYEQVVPTQEVADTLGHTMDDGLAYAQDEDIVVVNKDPEHGMQAVMKRRGEYSPMQHVLERTLSQDRACKRRRVKRKTLGSEHVSCRRRYVQTPEKNC